jgi:putative FmdB family regulatory protein
MPYYDYVCIICHDRFEAKQRVSDPVLRMCNNCGGELKKIYSSSPAIVFKGSGWHSKDYGKS